MELFIYVLSTLLVIIATVCMVRLVDKIRWGTGVLRINRSDPNKDVYRFEIDDIDILDKKKKILITIKRDDNKAFYEQET